MKLPKLIRRSRHALWRRLLSKPAEILLHHFYKIQLGHRPTFVGWPIFRGDGLIELGDNCVLVSSQLGNPIGLFRPCIIESIRSDSKVQIGKNFSASGVCIVAEIGIFIGNNVSVGANATIIDTDFHAANVDSRNNAEAASSKPIYIEDDVWVGMNAVILKGVTIHRGAVIGANAVVTKDVPAGAQAVGNPARIIFSNNIVPDTPEKKTSQDSLAILAELHKSNE